MSKNKPQKWYVVWRGHKPGIYDSWGKALNQVSGYSGALHKSFLSREEATEAFKNPPLSVVNKPDSPPPNGHSPLIADMLAALERVKVGLRR